MGSSWPPSKPFVQASLFSPMMFMKQARRYPHDRSGRTRVSGSLSAMGRFLSGSFPQHFLEIRSERSRVFPQHAMSATIQIGEDRSGDRGRAGHSHARAWFHAVAEIPEQVAEAADQVMYQDESVGEQDQAADDGAEEPRRPVIRCGAGGHAEQPER